jgi:hypothetical protein
MIKVFATAAAVGGAAVIGSTIIASSTVVNLFGRPAMTKADFDQEFADVAAVSSTANTPANREKLRELGWRLIQAQKR